MLFAALFRLKPGIGPSEETRRVLQMAAQGSKPPPGIENVGVYSLAHGDIRSVYLFKTDSDSALMANLMQWYDLYDITVVPAVTWDDVVDQFKRMQA